MSTMISKELACHHLEIIRQEKTTRETSQAVGRPGQILERHDLAEDSTRQANLEAAYRGLCPTKGHDGCSMMMMIDMLSPYYLTIFIKCIESIIHEKILLAI